MLYSLRGTIVHYDATSLAIECGGVAYYCLTTLSTLSQVAAPGNEALLYTHLNFRQDAVDLFAFADQTELRCFRMLIGVSGVGPKAALAILSALTPDQFVLSVASGDVVAITRAQGVGKKLAQRIVLELKDKVGAITTDGDFDVPTETDFTSGNTGEAIAALAALGYSQSEAASAIARLDQSLPVEELVKGGLKALAGTKF